MYNYEDLISVKCFMDYSRDRLLDPLTGVLTRQAIIEYTNSLIERNIPFSYQIIDIDNFKIINDNYGHKIGDEVLQEISAGLISYLNGRGYVGRFGGDEFIMVCTTVQAYDEVYNFLKNIYGEFSVLRKTIKCSTSNPFVTATIGSASFPKDATTYDDLFQLADKALYRGKMKGRNCFIVYVEEKHKNLDTSKKTRLNIADVFIKLSHLYENYYEEYKVLGQTIVELLKEDLHLQDVLILSSEMKTLFTTNTDISFDNCLISNLNDYLDENGFYNQHSAKLINEGKDEFLIECTKLRVRSFIAYKISFRYKTLGYLLFLEDKLERMFQIEEIALMIYVSNLLIPGLLQ